MTEQEIYNNIKEIIVELIDNPNISVEPSSALVGSNGIIDSLTLVELCVRLEDLAVENGFEFDWTSELAMSKSRGMFRSVENLSKEFYSQKPITQ